MSLKSVVAALVRKPIFSTHCAYCRLSFTANNE